MRYNMIQYMNKHDWRYLWRYRYNKRITLILQLVSCILVDLFHIIIEQILGSVPHIEQIGGTGPHIEHPVTRIVQKIGSLYHSCELYLGNSMGSD